MLVLPWPHMEERRVLRPGVLHHHGVQAIRARRHPLRLGICHAASWRSAQALSSRSWGTARGWRS